MGKGGRANIAFLAWLKQLRREIRWPLTIRRNLENNHQNNKVCLHGLEIFSKLHQLLWDPFYIVRFHMISAETKTMAHNLHIKFTHHLEKQDYSTRINKWIPPTPLDKNNHIHSHSNISSNSLLPMAVGEKPKPINLNSEMPILKNRILRVRTYK